MKRKVWMIAAAIAAAAAVGGFFLYRTLSQTDTGNEEPVYVDTVANLSGNGISGMNMKFSGVVEPQETWGVKLQTGKTVKDILVTAGQEVTQGTPLFTYDTAQAETDLAQAQLDSEKIDNDIANLNAQIDELVKERDKASADAKLDYTTQIQQNQMDVKKNEYDKKSKEVEIRKLQDTISNATVTSQIDGTVKNIGDKNAADTSTDFISILTTGAFRVKGTVNEQNIGSVAEGSKVIIRSRVNQEATWTGTMGKVDTQNQETQSSTGGVYMEGGNTAQSSSKYPFYVALDTSDGLMLGQHVYIEMDNGQDAAKEGIWLGEYYICDADSSPYVWADNGSGKLVKKEVVLGQHDENLMEYEITSGLSEQDLIAYPEEGLTEGRKTEAGSTT